MSLVCGPSRILLLDLELACAGLEPEEAYRAISRWFFDLPAVHQEAYRDVVEVFLNQMKPND